MWQVQIIDTWHRIWKLREIYLWMQNIHLYVGLSVCIKCTILVQKMPYYRSWLSHKGFVNLGCMLPWMEVENWFICTNPCLNHKSSSGFPHIPVMWIEHLRCLHNTWSLASRLATQNVCSRDVARKHIPWGAQNALGGVQSCTHLFSQEIGCSHCCFYMSNYKFNYFVHKQLLQYNSM